MINQAYETLSDENARDAYDALLIDECSHDCVTEEADLQKQGEAQSSPNG